MSHSSMLILINWRGWSLFVGGQLGGDPGHDLQVGALFPYKETFKVQVLQTARENLFKVNLGELRLEHLLKQICS